MNQLPPEKAAAVVSAIAHGLSIRKIVRLTGAAKNTIARYKQMLASGAIPPVKPKMERQPVLTVEDALSLNFGELSDGYKDGAVGLPCGDHRSRSYWHGWRIGMMDHGRMQKDRARQILAKAANAAS